MYVESTILYGSIVMKRDAHDTSVDLRLIINNWMTEQEIRNYVDAVTLVTWKRYGAKLRTIIFTEFEFVRRVKRSHASVQIILKEGQVISGKTIQELLGAS